MSTQPYVVSYNLCGIDLHSPALRHGRRRYRQTEELADGVPQLDTVVATDPEAVRFAFEDLDSEASYELEAVYVTERRVPRVQRMRSGTIELHGPIELSQAGVQSVRVPVPPEAIVDGVLEVTIERFSGPDAIVSRLILRSSKPASPVLVVAGDSRGGVIGTLSDRADEPLVGATVRMTGPLGELTAVTDHLGLFRFEQLPVPQDGDAQLEFSAEQHGVPVTVSVATSQFALGLRDMPSPHERISLNGDWAFRSGDVAANTPVPGHITFQGLVAKDGRGELSREFEVPADWTGRRLFLRFDAVYGAARVTVNGTPVGAHSSGATSFDVDITDAVHPGTNTLSVGVEEHSPHSVIDYMAWYAHMSLFGIWRDVTLFSTPSVHLRRTAITADWDCETGVGSAAVSTTVIGPDGSSFDLRIEVTDTDGAVVAESTANGVLADGAASVALDVTVPDAAPWSAERPDLYGLRLVVSSGEDVFETSRRIGFRRVEVVGGELRVNGSPIRVLGVNRHDARVLKGRAISVDDMRHDIERFREANINTIRTSHYPPHPEMVALCDELGMYLFLQPPATWVRDVSWSRASHSTRLLPYLFEITGETVARDRSSSSVITWDIANESEWTPGFEAVHAWVRRIDPSRGTFFSFDVQKTDEFTLPGTEPKERRPTVRSNHYPGWSGQSWEKDLEDFAQLDAPLVCDEHIPIFEACQRAPHELHALRIDPGVRDYWVTEVAPYLEKLHSTPNCIGGMVWSGVDDTFAIPLDYRVGYGEWEYLTEAHFIQHYDLLSTSDDVYFRGDGEWGVLDGWGRPRAEHWHLTKMYSPLEVAGPGLTEDGLDIEIRNLFSHLDLAETTATVTVDGESRELALVGAPGSTTPLRVDAPDARHVRFEVRHPGGWLVDAYEWDRVETTVQDEVLAGARAPGFTGSDTSPVRTPDSDAWLRALPVFHILSADNPELPLLAPVPDGSYRIDGSTATLEVADAAWKGSLTVVAKADRLEYSYRLEYLGNIRFNAREVGVSLRAVPALRDLWWSRDGEWSYYPDHHIGRNEGYAVPAEAPYDRLAPAPTWEEDTSVWGSVDYRSAKRTVLAAGLTDGSRSVSVVSDGTQTVRAALDGATPVLAVLDWYGGVRTLDGSHPVWSSYFGSGFTFERGTVASGQGVVVLGALPGSRRP